jgi:hypothetical protein
MDWSSRAIVVREEQVRIRSWLDKRLKRRRMSSFARRARFGQCRLSLSGIFRKGDFECLRLEKM